MIAICSECGKEAKIKGHGLCNNCYSRAWSTKNRDKINQYHAEYRSQHRELLNQKARVRQTSMRAEINRRSRERAWMLKLEMVAAYGGRCVCCGETEPIFLAIDHINGGGKSDRLRGHGGFHFYAKLKKLGWPKDEYRLLCHNCNMAIGMFGFCPHQGEK